MQILSARQRTFRALAPWALLMVCLCCGPVCQGQTGWLDASDFAQWTLEQGSSPAFGSISWQPVSACTVTSDGHTFVAVANGRPITIVDINPAHTETVVPTHVVVNQNSCSFQAVMQYVHNSYHLVSGTAGLQEALDYRASTGPSMVLLTSAWAQAGGTTAMIGAATGTVNTTILDGRTSLLQPYTWNGTAFAAATFPGSSAFFPATPGIPYSTSRTDSETATSAQIAAALNLLPTTQLAAALIPTLNQDTTGNARTATQLAATPTLCSAGNAPTGILANGNATGCQPVGGGGGGAVSSVSNSDGSLVVTPTTGAVGASLNLAHANIFTAMQSAPSFAATGTANGSIGLKSTGTLPSAAPASTVQLTVPNAVTAYSIELPGANPSTGKTYLSCTPANPSVCTWTTGPMYMANVKDYGAKGDGSTDDGTAIQNATAAATASCGTVYFPAGTYMHAATLTKPRCVVWKGVSTNGTTISYTGTGVAYVEGDTTVNASLSHAGGVQDLTFNGPVANGASGSTIGVYFGGDPAGTISSASNLDDNTHWDNVVVQNFALGAKAGNNFFLASFIRAVFVNNGSHFLYPSGLTNSGERISFKDSAFVQSSTGSAISINSPLAEFDFDATSFDYNDQSAADFTCTSGGMYVYISHSHFEKTHGEFIDIPSTCGMNMDISDSYILENGQDVTPVTQPDLIQFQAGNLGNLTLTIRGTLVYSNDPVTAFILTAANVSKQIELDGLQWGGLTNSNLPVAVNDNGNNNGLTISNTLGLTSFPAPPLSCQPGIGDGLNAIPAGTYLTATCRNETGQTWTISAIRCVEDAGTSTCNATNGAGTALLTGAITGSSTYASGTQSATTTIAPGDYLKVTFVADGTSKQIGIDVAGSY